MDANNLLRAQRDLVGTSKGDELKPESNGLTILRRAADEVVKRPGTNATEIFEAPCWPDDPSEGHPEIMPTSLHVYGIRNSVGAARTAGVEINSQSTAD